VDVEKRRHWRTATERGTVKRRNEGMAGCRNDMIYRRVAMLNGRCKGKGNFSVATSKAGSSAWILAKSCGESAVLK
jgi:hypothetical protein